MATCQKEACHRNRKTPAAPWPSWPVLASERDPLHPNPSPWWSQRTAPLGGGPTWDQTSSQIGPCPPNADQISLQTGGASIIWRIHAPMKKAVRQSVYPASVQQNKQSNLAWIMSPFWLVTCWLAAPVAAGGQLAIIIVIHWAGTAQTLIHLKPTFHQVHPFRFRHLTPPWDLSCSNKEHRWTAVTDEGAQTNSGQWRSACCDRAGLLTTGSVSWRQIYSGLRTERRTPHTTEPEREAGCVNMR